MKTKQTAVEWLINEIDMQYPEIHVRWKEWMIDKAKEMEKEQMINFAIHLHKVDMSNTGTDILLNEAEQYYNETYGK